MRQNQTNLVLGILLILIGGWLVVSRQVPAVQNWLADNFTWPMYTIGAGLIVFLIGLLTGAPGMSVPAAIIAGIGGILYYQNQTDDYGSWSYIWALIPGFVGVGTILAGLLMRCSPGRFQGRACRSCGGSRGPRALAAGRRTGKSRTGRDR